MRYYTRTGRRSGVIIGPWTALFLAPFIALYWVLRVAGWLLVGLIVVAGIVGIVADAGLDRWVGPWHRWRERHGGREPVGQEIKTFVRRALSGGRRAPHGTASPHGSVPAATRW